MSQPLLVGLTTLQQLINIPSVKHLAFLSVYHQDLSRPDTTLGNDLIRLVSMGANFRGQRDKAVIGCHPPRRAQTIAIEEAAGVAAIGQHNAGRTVPGLHVHGVVLVKRFQIRVDAFDILPSRRNQHAQCTRQLNTARGQQFQHIVET